LNKLRQLSQTAFTFGSINLVATNRHEINIHIVDINMHLSYCLSRICMEEDVLCLAEFSYNKLNNFIQSHTMLINQPQKCLRSWRLIIDLLCITLPDVALYNCKSFLNITDIYITQCQIFVTSIL